VWWSWTAPVSGSVSISLVGSDYPFPVAIFTGDTLPELQSIPVTRAMSGDGNLNLLSFEAVAGTTYQMAVSDAGGLTGAVKFRLQAPMVELSSAWILSGAPDLAVLGYHASAGQIILLQRSPDRVSWRNAQIATAHSNWVAFLVRPPPAATGPHFRAIIVDRNSP